MDLAEIIEDLVREKKELTFQKKRIGRHTYEKESKNKARENIANER